MVPALCCVTVLGVGTVFQWPYMEKELRTVPALSQLTHHLTVKINYLLRRLPMFNPAIYSHNDLSKSAEITDFKKN